MPTVRSSAGHGDQGGKESMMSGQDLPPTGAHGANDEPAAPGHEEVSGAAWLASFLGRLDSVTDAVAGEQATTGPLPSREEQARLLDLARLAAHGSQRWAAPVTTYLTGRRLAGLSADQRIAVLNRLVAELEDAADR